MPAGALAGSDDDAESVLSSLSSEAEEQGEQLDLEMEQGGQDGTDDDDDDDEEEMQQQLQEEPSSSSSLLRRQTAAAAGNAMKTGATSRRKGGQIGLQRHSDS